MVKKLPPVKQILGIYLGPDSMDYVSLQYESEDGEICDLLMPLDRALRIEEFFIKLRNQLAGRRLQRNAATKG
jgi:hypothetical protein